MEQPELNIIGCDFFLKKYLDRCVTLHIFSVRPNNSETLIFRCARTAAAAALLDAGADVHHGDRSGQTPLDHAVTYVPPSSTAAQLSASSVCGGGNSEDSADMVRLLMERGSAMEHVDLEGRRPLDRAIEAGKAHAVQAFLRKGAKLGPATWASAATKPDIL